MAVPSTFSVQLSVSIVLHDSCLSLLHRTLSSLSVAAGQAQDSGLLRGLTVTLVDNASGATYREQLAALVDEWPSDGLRLQCEWRGLLEEVPPRGGPHASLSHPHVAMRRHDSGDTLHRLPPNVLRGNRRLRPRPQ